MATALCLSFPDGRSCPVRLGEGAAMALPELWQPGWEEAALIADATVMGLYGEHVASLLRPLVRRLLLCPFPPGEAHKTRDTKAALEDRLLEAGLSRQSCVVALGGGISLDLGGFVAATYLRGVPYCSLPTSLLAQVDASVGGKTGVNTPHGKNLIGAFQQAAAVLIDPRFLLSLPLAEWRNGLAELVKHAVIADVALFAWLEANAAAIACPGAMDDYPLRRSVEIKAEVVGADEHEKGRRAVLNFGHTVGHALEHACQHRLPHGIAVAAGMSVEARLAARLCGFPAEERSRLERLLGALGLPSGPPAGLSFDELRPFLRLDKKRRAGELRLALPRRIGEMVDEDGTATVPASVAEIGRAFEETPCSA
jgi:3-dehydroquinate synthase